MEQLYGDHAILVEINRTSIVWVVHIQRINELMSYYKSFLRNNRGEMTDRKAQDKMGGKYRERLDKNGNQEVEKS